MTDIQIDVGITGSSQTHLTEPEMQRSFCFIGMPGTKKTLTLKTFMPPEWKEGDHSWARIFACDRKKDGGMAVLRGVKGIDYTVHANPELHGITSIGSPYKYPEPKGLEVFTEEANKILTLGVEEAQHLRLIIESIRRTAEYASDIAEIVLNLTIESILS